MKRLILFASLSSACGGSGDLMVTTYGEDFIEQEIPAAAGPDEEGLVDGYTVRYTKFLVALSDIRVANHDGEIAGEEAAQRIWDLTKPGPHAVTRFTDIPADHWNHVSARVLPADGAAGGNAQEADVTLMNAEGWSVRAEGTASNGRETYSFAWGFSTSTLYDACVDADEREGIDVPTGGSETMQLTVHGDHLFYDDLQSEAPSLRFAPFAAADTDGDRDVTLAELAAVDLTALPADQYGTGGDPSVNDLAAFVEALTRTLVHFQGEGHCQQVKL